MLFPIWEQRNSSTRWVLSRNHVDMCDRRVLYHYDNITFSVTASVSHLNVVIWYYYKQVTVETQLDDTFCTLCTYW